MSGVRFQPTDDVYDNDIELDATTDATTDRENIYSETTSQTEYISTDLLASKKKGIRGYIEDIHIGYKLSAIISVNLVAAVALAVFLLVLGGIAIAAVLQTRMFMDRSGILRQAINSLSDERDIVLLYRRSSEYLYTNGTELQHIGEAFAFTDYRLKYAMLLLRPYIIDTTIQNNTIINGTIVDSNTIVIKNDTDLSTMNVLVNSLVRNLETLDDIRGDLDFPEKLLGGSSEDDFMDFYSNAIETLLNIMSVFSQQAGSEAAVGYSGFLNIIEEQRKVRIGGQGVFSTGLLNAMTSDGVRKYTTSRDFALRRWMTTTSSSMRLFYNSNVDQILLTLLTKAETEITKPRDSYRTATIPSGYTLDIWNSQTEWIDDDLEEVGFEILRVLEREIQSSTTTNVGIMIGAVVIVLACLIVSVFTTVGTSLTIIGKWQRMTYLLQNSISKFVPNDFLNLIGFKDITEIDRGKCVERDISILTVDIKNLELMNLDKEGRLSYLNDFTDSFEAGVLRYGGYIYDFTQSGFIAHFKRTDSSIKAALDMHALSTTFKGTPALATSIHSGRTLVGTLGSSTRMKGSVFGRNTVVSETLKDIASSFDAVLLITKSAFSKAIKLKKTVVKLRDVGRIMINGKEEEMVEMLLADPHNIHSYKEDFQTAMDDMYAGSYMTAYKRLSGVLREIPNDKLTSVYTKKAKELSDQCKGISREVGIREALRDPIYFEGFYSYCESERSTENIDLWKDIQKYRSLISPEERINHAANIWRDYFIENSIHMININDKLRTVIGKGIAQIDAGIAPDDSFFDDTEKEMELLMNDTYARFKTCDAFVSCVAKTEQAPAKPYLNYMRL
jgi:class 3 adenylate cyclase